MAPPGTRFDKMFLIGIWVQTVLYGLNCAVFGTAIYVLLAKRANRPTFPALTIVSTFLFSMSTAYVAISFRQLMEAFIFAPPGGASHYFGTQTSPLAVSKLVLYSINVLAQNSILIWRLWAVWGRKWKVIVFPVLLLIMETLATFIAIGIGSQTLQPRLKGLYILIVRRMSIVNWIMDLAINIGATAAIAFRLWTMGHAVGSVSSGMTSPRENKYYGVMRMMIESGLLFSTATLVTVAIYLTGSLATVNAIDSIVQLATITPLLIIVRVGLGLTHAQPTTDHSSTKLSFRAGPNINISTDHQTEETRMEFEMSPHSVKGSSRDALTV